MRRILPEMEDAAYILLIVVSSVLSVFLILLSIAIVYFIKFLRKADDLAESVESAATAFRRSVAAVPILRFVSDVLTKSRKEK